MVLTNVRRAKMEPRCLGKPGDPGRSGGSDRPLVGAVLWVARAGSPWRDLPAVLGRWGTAFERCRGWARADASQRLLDACSDAPGLGLAMIDGAMVKAHRHGQGARGGAQSQAIGRPKGGLATKALALALALADAAEATSCALLCCRGSATTASGCHP